MGGGPPGFRPGFTCLVLLGILSGRPHVFAHGTVTLSGATFQTLELDDDFITSCRIADFGPRVPQPRRHIGSAAVGNRRFGLLPVRSPLLGESRFLSFPPGTEMFQFSGFALRDYAFTTK